MALNGWRSLASSSRGNSIPGIKSSQPNHSQVLFLSSVSPTRIRVRPNFQMQTFSSHAGDLIQSGSLKELQAILAWLCAQPHPIKIVVAGNQDLLLDAGRDDSTKQAVSERAKLD